MRAFLALVALSLPGCSLHPLSSGDIGIKNSQLQASVGNVAVKIANVVGTLESAAQVAPGASSAK